MFFISSFAQIKINPTAIDIVRDSFGVPHIFAKTDAEVAYGLAWAEAEDDFKSMQEIILPAKNLMASVQGKKGAPGDYAFALFRCREITEEKWNTLTPAFLKLIDGYLQGLNTYAQKHPEEVIHKKIFPITAKEYISSSVFALTIFNGADKALIRIFNNSEWEAPELNKKGSNSAAVSSLKTTTGEAFLMINAHPTKHWPTVVLRSSFMQRRRIKYYRWPISRRPMYFTWCQRKPGLGPILVKSCDRLDEFQLGDEPR